MKHNYKHIEEIYQCYALGGRLNFQSKGLSICHSLECEDPFIEFDYNSDANIADVYSAFVKQIIKEIQQKDRCTGCSILKRQAYKPVNIKIITLNINIQCNCRCLYCCSHSSNMEQSVNIVPYLKQLADRNMISADCFLDFGGGEPTIDPYFEETLDYAEKNRYMIRVNTNAIKYSYFLESHLKNNPDINVRISVDSGKRETYQKIKGTDAFDNVWENIGNYRKASDNISIKYVITKYNVSQEDLSGFVMMCEKYHITQVFIDIDHDAYTGNDRYGWADYTEDMLNAARSLMNMAKERGIRTFAGYVWTADDNSQESYDYNLIEKNADGRRILTSGATILLPEKYIRHREKACITYKRYNDLTELCSELKGRKVFLYGAGYFGEKMYEVIQNKVTIEGFVDLNLGGSTCMGKKVIFPHELKTMADIDVIITCGACNEVMEYINREGINQLANHLYYITLADLIYYEKKLN